MYFYTNVQVYGSKILYRGVESGQKVKRKLEYNPTLFVLSQNKTQHKTLAGEYLSPVNFSNIREARDFTKKYTDIDNLKIYGNQRYEYVYISENFNGHIDWDRSHIRVANIDIEVGSENGFPNPESASEPIISITTKFDDAFIVFGCGDFDNTRNDVEYIKCQDEVDLIKSFLRVWSANYPDVVTGWHIKFFDIPYLYNRIRNVLGEAWAKKLSPWNICTLRSGGSMSKEQQYYTILGIACLDYIELYRKFSPKGMSQESYKLDHIAQVELKQRKIQYEGSLHRLYKENYQLFITYNIRDVELVDRLDDKLKLLNLAFTLAYDSKTNFEDVFAQTRMWDSIIYNHLRKKNMVIPPNEKHRKDAAYIGAHVKDPILGMHKWIASFDLNSLYPMLIQQYNISPDTIIEPENYNEDHRNIIRNRITVDNLLDSNVDLRGLVSSNCTMTPNGQFFTKERHGFLPEIMEKMYADRKAYKDKMLSAQKELEAINLELSKRKDYK